IYETSPTGFGRRWTATDDLKVIVAGFAHGSSTETWRSIFRVLSKTAGMKPQQLRVCGRSSDTSVKFLSLLPLLQCSGESFAKGQNSFSDVFANASQQNRKTMPLSQIDMNAAIALREFFLNCFM